MLRRAGNEMQPKVMETKEGLVDYFLSVMTYSDRADVDKEMLEKYAEHAMMLRNTVSWCKELPQDIFLPCVAEYRINNEAIVDVRKMFFDEIYPRIKDMSLKDAILEVNYWCAENGTYHSSDSRTASALTVYKTGLGRCGEESVLAVTALRSVGIAARQIYTPLWSHCDDNHAWVEVYCDGRWQFLGACEPEPTLNRGWFAGPATRAMLIHARYFGSKDYPDKVAEDGGVAYIGSIQNYAVTRQFELRVVDEQHHPISGLTIELQVLNYGRYGKLITMYTDEDGRVQIQIGVGDMRVKMRDDEKSQIVQVPYTQNQLEVVFDGRQEEKDIWKEYHFHAPKENIAKENTVTEEQQKQNALRVKEAKKIREDRIASYYDEKKAQKFADCEEIQKCLKLSYGNFEEVYAFLTKDENEYRKKMILSLKEKDLYDCKADILEEHLQQALKVKGDYPDNIFVPYILNPRVEQEELTTYRKEILEYLDESLLEEFKKEPQKLYSYIKNEIKYNRQEDYPVLRISPMGALKSKKGNFESQKILFVAILRSLGVPARLDPMDREPEYYRDGKFHEVNSKGEEEIKEAVFMLHFEEGEDWKYHLTWTLNKLEQGSYHTLRLRLEDLEGEDNHKKLCVSAGIYQIIITTRLINGDQMVREFYTEVKNGETKEIYLRKATPDIEDKVSTVSLTDLPVLDREGKKTCLIKEKAGERKLFIWLGIGEEPTEHVLNELLEEEESAFSQKDKIFLLVKNYEEEANDTLKKVLERIQPQLYCPEKFLTWEQIAQKLGDENAKRLPVGLVVNRDGKGIYGTFGYNVGSVHQMLMHLKNENE